MPLSTKDLERQPPAMQANKEGRYTGQGKETAMNMSFISVERKPFNLPRLTVYRNNLPSFH